MKSNIQISFYSLLLVLGSFLTACEVIPEGEQTKEIFTPIDSSAVKRTSLLIEYSGWRCVNCPTAAEEAHHLKELYGENLVVVVMHPETNPNTSYTNAAGKPNEAVNYTCPEADSIYIMMGGTKETAFPTGNINLLKNDSKSYFTEYSTWGKYISQAYSNPQPVVINQEVKGTADSKEINIVVDITNHDTKAIEATLQVWLTEDSVMGSQKKPEGTDKSYAHNHLMRASISPLWGDIMPIEAHMTEQQVYRYPLPEKVVKENCNIVALVSVNGEVVQATETKISIE